MYVTLKTFCCCCTSFFFNLAVFRTLTKYNIKILTLLTAERLTSLKRKQYRPSLGFSYFVMSHISVLFSNLGRVIFCTVIVVY